MMVFNNGTNVVEVSTASATPFEVASGGTGRGTLTANNVILGNGTSQVQFVAPGTSGNLLTSNGTTWASAAPPTSFVTGMILLWSGSIASVPSGWQLCDGTNGTPNLRDRFVVGAGSTYAVNATGGSADAIVVSHTHTATSTVTDPGHNHTTTLNATNNQGGGPASAFWSGGGVQGTGTFTTSTATTGITVATTNASAGTSGTNANLPPYYALAYIMKL
jgi:hypothetical protein